MQRRATARNAKTIVAVTPESTTSDGQWLLPSEYLAAIERAGGVPFVLVPWLEGAVELLDAADGLLLAGGGDVAPGRYGSAGHPEIYEVNEARDAGEFALLAGAIESGLPTLGICRGAQLLNVALGGTLIEHLPDAVDGSVTHRSQPNGGVLHEVRVAPGSRVREILGVDCVKATSWHHQAIDKVANTLTPVAWAEDGTIEAVEMPGHSWLIAVQWHPELTAATDPTQQHLFDAFVAAARRAT